ncbi:hypothetical protein H1C71_012395 [Ictidomys tridecemlineatus]|nr:hypothetical protein H1C71_012395 [Ictidomys tridecemlineatus]
MGCARVPTGNRARAGLYVVRRCARACSLCSLSELRIAARVVSERSFALSGWAASERRAQEARAGSLASPDGPIVLAPHLLSILEKLKEYITSSVRGTKGRVFAGHTEVAPKQATRAPAPEKLFSRARGTSRGFSFLRVRDGDSARRPLILDTRIALQHLLVRSLSE